MARPSKYETHVAPRLTEIEDWVRNGATDEDVRERLGIAESTFYEYKKQFSEFSELLKKSKDFVDAQVENALLRRALGYEFKEITKELRDGELVPTKIVTKHMPSDTAALIFWQKKRRPDKWRDKPKEEEGTEDRSLNITFAIEDVSGGEE